MQQRRGSSSKEQIIFVKLRWDANFTSTPYASFRIKITNKTAIFYRSQQIILGMCIDEDVHIKCSHQILNSEPF